MHLEIDRSNIRNHQIVDSQPRALQPGDVLLSVQSLALTSNNISYALSGDFLDYWGFFPTEAGWGRLPAMGYGIVTESLNDGVPVGNRYWGFFPIGDHHVVSAQATSSGFVDVAPHREKHAMAYRSFDRVSDEHHETDDANSLLRGLFLTSFLAEDFLFENGMFGAGQIVISSASSKTAIALAHRIRARGNTHCIGLTSASNVSFVEKVNLYDEVATYDDIESLAEWSPTVFVDMAGNASVISRIHHHFNDALVHSCSIGATHWDQGGSKADLPGPAPAFFFAPSQLAKRGKEWGRDEVNSQINSALEKFIADSTRWMEITSSDASSIEAAYDQLVDGNISPSVGTILRFQ
jgi:hypothetical protein